MDGLAAIITMLIMAPITILVIVWVVRRKVAVVQEIVEETLAQTIQVNHAVNGKDPRQSTLSEDVITIRDKQEVDSPTDAGESEALLPLVKKLTQAVAEISERLK